MDPAPRFPAWLHLLAIASLCVAIACAMAIALDQLRRPQKMKVMAIVWPLTALFGSIVWLAVYCRSGRAPTGSKREPAHRPFAVAVFIGTSHCGAGCTLGDMLVEWAAVACPALAIWFGYGSLFGERMFAIWIADFIAAFLTGIAFQYFAIKPMRDLSVGQGIIEALKADILSISAWQIGMYGGMALIQFAWFRPSFGHFAPVTSPEFWFAMQIAMLAGFVTSYPVNVWLLKAGLKEAM